MVPAFCCSSTNSRKCSSNSENKWQKYEDGCCCDLRCGFVNHDVPCSCLRRCSSTGMVGVEVPLIHSKPKLQYQKVDKSCVTKKEIKCSKCDDGPKKYMVKKDLLCRKSNKGRRNHLGGFETNQCCPVCLKSPNYDCDDVKRKYFKIFKGTKKCLCPSSKCICKSDENESKVTNCGEMILRENKAKLVCTLNESSCPPQNCTINCSNLNKCKHLNISLCNDNPCETGCCCQTKCECKGVETCKVDIESSPIKCTCNGTCCNGCQACCKKEQINTMCKRPFDNPRENAKTSITCNQPCCKPCKNPRSKACDTPCSNIYDTCNKIKICNCVVCTANCKCEIHKIISCEKPNAGKNPGNKCKCVVVLKAPTPVVHNGDFKEPVEKTQIIKNPCKPVSKGKFCKTCKYSKVRSEDCVPDVDSNPLLDGD